MKILVLNCGSSSIKYKLFDMDSNKVIAKGGVEKLGMPGAFLELKLPNGEKVLIEKEMQEHTAGVEFILENLLHPVHGAIKSLDEIDAVGHRIVHGGEHFNQSVLLDEKMLEVIESCNDLAPLHNPANLKGVAAISKTMPKVPQVGVFDTAFHQTMPKKAYLYGLPYEYYEKYKVRRYGFHGTSHDYVSSRIAEIFGQKREDMKIIVCHLGNGASVSAVDGGKCVDTSMGLTPLEGLIMGTRSGDMDPAIIGFLAQKEGKSAEEIINICNKKSGVLGLSGGVSSDFRDLATAADEGNELAQTALEAWSYRVAKYIGAYAAAMNGVDVIVFTAGVGENNVTARAQVMGYLGYLGVTMNEDANTIRGEEVEISTEDSTTKVWVVPTDEEMAIARATEALVG